MIAGILPWKPYSIVEIRRAVVIQMIRLSRILLTAAFSLLSVLSAQATPSDNAHKPKPSPTATPVPTPPPIQISSLPFNITAPGAYVLTNNLSYPSTGFGTNPVAIGISLSTAVGPIILDLQGFTITNTNPQNASECIRIQTGSQVLVQNPLTIRNGTISNFSEGVSDYLVYPITVTNVTFNVVTPTSDQNPPIWGVGLTGTSNSTVSNCHFTSTINLSGVQAIGIYDYSGMATGGNTYNNNTFTNIFTPLTVSGAPGSPGAPEPKILVLSNCQFAPPPSN